MAISGDLSTLNLTEVLQSITQAASEGTLMLTDGQRSKTFIFSPRGITLETSEERLASRLGDILVANGKLTAPDLRRAEAHVAAKGGSLEEALLELRAADRKAVDQALRIQVEEEMYDVFSWEGVRFEFQPGRKSGEGQVPKAKPKTRMLFNVSGMLMEASRRIDEWKMIQKVIPGLAGILEPTPALKGTEFQGLAKTVIGLCDGARTVAEIAEEGHTPRFETCKLLKELAEAGKLRVLGADELVVIARRDVEARRAERAVSLLRLALGQQPDRHAERLLLAETLEGLGRKPEAGHEYRRLADVKLAAGDPKTAVQILKVVAELLPEETEARERALSLTLDHLRAVGARPADVAKEALPLVRGLLAGPRRDVGLTLLERLLQVAPDQPELWGARINVSLEAADTDGAADGYRRLLPILEAARDRSGVEQAARALQKLVPDDPAAAAALGASAAGAGAGRKATVIAPATRTGGGGGGLKWLLILLVLGGGGFAGYREWQARGAVAAARSRLAALAPEVRATEGAALLRGVAEAWPFTLATRGLPVEADALAAAGPELEARRKAEAVQAAEQAARAAEAAGDVGGALVKFRAAVTAARGTPDAERLTADVARLEKRGADADTLAAAAEAQIQAGEGAAAHATLRDLRTRFPESAAARNAKFPVTLVTRPAGAAAHEGETALGATPVTVRVAADAARTVTVVRRGFKTAAVRLAADRGPTVELDLVREPVWSQPFAASVEHVASASAGGVLVALRDGSLRLLDGTGATRWTAALQAEARPGGPPVIAGDVVVWPAADGGLRAFDAAGGASRWTREVGAPVVGTLQADATTVTAATARGMLVSVSALDGAPRFAMPLGGTPRGGACGAGDRVVGAVEGGPLVAFRLEDGAEAWRSAEAAVGPVLAADAGTIVCGHAGGLVAHAQADGARRWTADLAGPVGAARWRDTWLVVSSDGTCTGLGDDGGPRWTRRLDGTIEARPLVLSPDRAAVIAGGILHELGPDGTVRFTWRTAGPPLRGGPVAAADGCVVATEGAVHALVAE